MKDFFSWLILVPLSLGILTEAFESSPFLGFGMVVPVGGGTKERSKVFFVQPQKALSSSVSNGFVDRRRIRSHPHPGLAASDNDTADNNGNDAYDFNAAFRARKGRYRSQRNGVRILYPTIGRRRGIRRRQTEIERFAPAVRPVFVGRPRYSSFEFPHCPIAIF